MKPEGIYKSDWKGTEEFFETYIGFNELKKICKKEKITSSSEYSKFFKKYQRKYRLMSHPERKFKKEWKGWDIFLEK